MATKILVGTDGSRTAARAVDRAVDVAKASGATLTIFSAGRRSHAEEVVAGEAARHVGSGVAIETAVAEGDPATELVAAAQHGGYDLLVTGSRGLTPIARVLRLGSVPSKVMLRLPCNLLVVKTT